MAGEVSGVAREPSGRSTEDVASAPRVLIAGTQSGVGKTTIALGILGAFRRRGLRVQPFKVGPDYIDGSYHTAVAGLPCRNLDAWLLPRRELLRVAARAAARADLSVIEGVMGLFDGSGRGDRCSSAHIARLLRCPVILVIDGSASSTSVGAQALGFTRFDPRVEIAGVIVNRVYGARHADWCAAAVRRAGARLLGCLPHDRRLALPERHLGLVPLLERNEAMPEDPRGARSFRAITDHAARHIDLEAVLEIAHGAPPLAASVGESSCPDSPATSPERLPRKPTIGVAFDSAFNFYYRDGLDALEGAGACLRYFSPVAGEFPECDALYIGGGFPETHLTQLEASPSTPLIRRFCESGAPVLAECGGLMYLSRGITDFDGRSGRMVGILDAETHMVQKLTLAYTVARARSGCFLARTGSTLRGHEFHSSVLQGVPRDARFAYLMEVGTGIDRRDGWMEHSVMASYMHTHLAAKRKAAMFVQAARKQGRR